MRSFRNADDYGDPLKNVRFFRDMYRSPQSIVDSTPRIAVVRPGEVYEDKATHAAGNFIAARPYSSQPPGISYPEPHTPILHTPLPGMPELHIRRYNEDIDRTIIDHTLVELFGEKMLDSGLEDMDSNGRIDFAPDEGFTVLDVPGLVSGILLESSVDDISETDPAFDFATEDILDDSSGTESPAVEQMLDEILLDDAVDDMPLGDIEDILDEHIADEMPEDNVQEMEPDMDTLEDPMEMIPYTL